MKDPEEKKQQEQDEKKATSKNVPAEDHSESNWDKHQQVDEEGNEVGPDDIK